MAYVGEQPGWQVVEWTLDIEPGVFYLVEVEPSGAARALYVTRYDRLPISSAMSFGDALVVCARHAEKNEVQTLVAGGWRPSSWALPVARAKSRHARYVIDVEPDGAARAGYSSLDEHLTLGTLPDLGHAIAACHKNESARMFAPRGAAL